MLLAPDARQSGPPAGQKGGLIHGVNEYYAACRLRPAPATATAQEKSHDTNGLLPVRPVAVLEKELLVEVLPAGSAS